MKTKITSVVLFLALSSLAIIACKKKDDDSSSTTTTSSTSSTSTTATTSTTSTTSTTTTNPTPGDNELAIDGQVIQWPVANCFPGAGGDWSIVANQETNGANTFIALFNPEPSTDKQYSISISQPNGDNTKVRLTLEIENITYTAVSGTVDVTVSPTKTISFTNVTFTKTGVSSKVVSGKLICP